MAPRPIIIYGDIAYVTLTNGHVASAGAIARLHGEFGRSK